MIFLGPGGVPIASKEKSTISGVKTCKELGLNAMEVEFVRGVNMSPKLAEDLGRLQERIKLDCQSMPLIS